MSDEPKKAPKTLPLYPETHAALEARKELTKQPIQFIGNSLILKGLAAEEKETTALTKGN